MVYGDEMALDDAVCHVASRSSRPEAIGRIAARMAAAGEVVSPELAAPVYVRNRVALTMAERARGERLQ